MEGPAVNSSEHQMQMEALPYPLSSRAKPRDLQFYRPLLEMFFDRSAAKQACDAALASLGNKHHRKLRAQRDLGLYVHGLPGNEP